MARHVQVGPDVWHLTLRAPTIAASALPGQFLQVQVQAPGSSYDPLLPRPFSICTLEPQLGEVAVIYRVVGRGTALLAAVGPGAPLHILGPLGRSFPDPASGSGRLLLVGGGLGSPPLAAAARWAAARRPVALLGARHAADLAGRGEIALHCPVQVCTDDGSEGRRGLVTDLLADELEPGAEVWACGPTPMLAAIAALCARQGADAWLSLEAPMACGFGVCMGCAVPSGRLGYLKACVDGAVFPAAAVDWPRITRSGEA